MKKLVFSDKVYRGEIVLTIPRGCNYIDISATMWESNEMLLNSLEKFMNTDAYKIMMDDFNGFPVARRDDGFLTGRICDLLEAESIQQYQVGRLISINETTARIAFKKEFVELFFKNHPENYDCRISLSAFGNKDSEKDYIGIDQAVFILEKRVENLDREIKYDEETYHESEPLIWKYAFAVQYKKSDKCFNPDRVHIKYHEINDMTDEQYERAEKIRVTANNESETSFVVMVKSHDKECAKLKAIKLLEEEFKKNKFRYQVGKLISIEEDLDEDLDLEEDIDDDYEIHVFKVQCRYIPETDELKTMSVALIDHSVIDDGLNVVKKKSDNIYTVFVKSYDFNKAAVDGCTKIRKSI